ncbi:MAG: hypothetical protein M1436_03755 [Acidobacteria bacterium]|nr:hypothetical protein [Acidobacteriota bacterium]
MRRREFLAAGAAALAPAPKKTVAAIVTVYRPRSHADVICGRILEGYFPDNRRVAPRTRIVSMYVAQTPANDMSRGLAGKHGFKIYPSIKEALTLGGPKLAVDAVLFVGEHGEYPWNDRGQHLYPRYEMFQEIMDVVRSSGRRVPVYCDKHFSYSWEKAKRMYDQAREFKLPLMAGSSIPVTVRTPELEFPLGAPVEHAVAVGYGDTDAYGFHILETLQCMVERRRGAETGIAAVHMLEGEAVWKWRAGEGAWSAPLAQAACATSPRTKTGRMEANCGKPVLFALEYRDGFRAACYILNGHTEGFLFAGRAQGRVLASCFGIPQGGRDLPHFDGLVHCIEELFVTGKPLYPVERTLLTTGALAFLFESRVRKQRVATPELSIAYRAPRNCYFERS